MNRSEVPLHANHPEPARVGYTLESLRLTNVLRIEQGDGIRLQAEIRTEQGTRWLD